MRTVRVNAASKSYDVLIGRGAVNVLGDEAKKVCPGALKVLVVSESNVAPLYLDAVKAKLADAGLEVFDYVFEAGEQNKNINEIAGMWNKMAENGFTRTDFVVGLGGGVTTDMAGFAASTFLRGIKVIQLPTSLLAMVDASVGGKTGIDIPMGKNQVGAFWQPSLVLEDISFLKTLPDEVFTEGMGEVTKHAFIMDLELLGKLEKADGNIRDDEDVLEEIVYMNVADKASVVGEDETDNGRRQTLNFGHTVGHVIERDSGFAKPHGMCVAMGMGIIIDACVRAGTLKKEDADGYTCKQDRRSRDKEDDSKGVPGFFVIMKIFCKQLNLDVKAPPSKSVYHRELIVNYILGARGKFLDDSDGDNDDVRATKSCLRALEEDSKEIILNCNESGSTLRFMIPVALAMKSPSTEKLIFKTRGRLIERPVKELEECLKPFGVEIIKDAEANEITVTGNIDAGRYVIDGSVSSQYISGLLMALSAFR